MRLIPLLLVLAVAFSAVPASADLIPPEAFPAAKRLRDNPNAFDRVDNFCAGKKPEDSCSIPGASFAGGGSGVCSNNINRTTWTIDLSCVRNDSVSIDRKMSEAESVGNACRDHSAEGTPESKDRRTDPLRDCVPPKGALSDRFCKDREVGSACTVELTYQGKIEHHDGICKRSVEARAFSYGGRGPAARQLILCEPATVAARTYAPVPWWQKLTQ